MQFKKSAVVGVLITLCLSTDSWCLYIPDKNPPTQENKTTDNSPKIQICGNALTTFIIEACDGFVGSLNQANMSRDSVHTKITEDCCDQQCPLDYLENYCGGAPLFLNNKSMTKILEKLGLRKPESKKKKKSSSEDNRNNRNNQNKQNKQNNVNRSWPSIEIGTISPEIDQFGGQPIVMFKKAKSNAI